MINTLSIRAPNSLANQSRVADNSRAAGTVRSEAYATISGSMGCKTRGVALPVVAGIIVCVSHHPTLGMLR